MSWVCDCCCCAYVPSETAYDEGDYNICPRCGSEETRPSGKMRLSPLTREERGLGKKHPPKPFKTWEDYHDYNAKNFADDCGNNERFKKAVKMGWLKNED